MNMEASLSAPARRLKILLVSAKPAVDFSTFYIPINNRWRSVYSAGIRWVTGVPNWEIPRGQNAVLANRNLTLEALANIIGDDHDVTLHDEFFGQVNAEQAARYDLVGISIFTATAKRGYELSDALRRRGCKVVLGGSHVQACREESLQHADAIVPGEAEDSLPGLLEDLAHGRDLQQVYSAPPPDLTRIRGYSPDHAFDGRSWPALNLAFSRGCVFKCEFCAISQTQVGFRHRPVAHTLADLDRGIAAGIRSFFIPDALMWGDRPAVRQLLTEMARRRIRWYGQASLDVARDLSMLDLIAQSGCSVLGLGIESIDPENLKLLHKRKNRTEDYEKTFCAMHERGIRINGYFVFGLDGDTPATFRRTAQFIEEHGIEIPEVYTLIPFPGTALHERLSAEGRILTRDWNAYIRFANVPVFRPKHMTPEELACGIRSVEQSVYSWRGILRRLHRAGRLRDPLSLFANAVMRNRVRKVHGPWKHMQFQDYYRGGGDEHSLQGSAEVATSSGRA